jgi:hypothetical protein
MAAEPMGQTNGTVQYVCSYIIVCVFSCGLRTTMSCDVLRYLYGMILYYAARNFFSHTMNECYIASRTRMSTVRSFTVSADIYFQVET